MNYPTIMHTFITIFNKCAGGNACCILLGKIINTGFKICELDLGVIDPVADNMYYLRTYAELRFVYLVTRVLDNPFINQETQLQFLDTFSKAQRLYRAFSNLARRYKLSISPVRINVDLYMNPIEENSPNVMTIMQDNQKYLFTTNDLVHIMETALCNSPNFFSEPLVSKNPYTNMPFRKSDLYNIYFFLLSQSKNNNISELIQKYYYSCFNLKWFRDTNQVLIRNVFLDKYLKNNDSHLLLIHIIKILYNINYGKKIYVDPAFPIIKLIDIMRPYIRLYYTYLHSFDLYARSTALYELEHRLKRFRNFNPYFGRKIIKIKCGKLIVMFNDKHVEFKKLSRFHSFATSHLTIDEQYDFYEEDHEHPDYDSDGVDSL